MSEDASGGAIGAAKPDLRGRAILICRPPEAARTLAFAIEKSGGRALIYPALFIHPFFSGARLRRFDGAKSDWVIFVSANAVNCFWDFFANKQTPPPPIIKKIAAVGEITAAALRARGVASEAITAPRGLGGVSRLLRLAAFSSSKIAGKKIAVICAKGGSRKLRDALRARGARVAEVACYQRLPPPPGALAGLRKKNLRIDAAAIFSVQTLDNLLSAGVDLRAVPLFASHPQIAAAAHKRGFSTIITVAESGADALIAAIAAHFYKQPQ
jgi:uroporphyrinogen-III synthase